MATYYPSSNNQRDIMAGIYLRDSSPSSYPEASVLPSNMMTYMNYSSSARSYSDNCNELPSLGSSESAPAQEGILSNLVVSHLGEQAYGVWKDGRNEMLFAQRTSGPSSVHSIDGQLNSRSDNLVHNSVIEDSQMGMQTQLGILHGQNLQGLSLSLSPQIPSAVPVPNFQFRHPNSSFSSFLSPRRSVSGEGGSGTGTGTGSCRDDESSQREQLKNGFPSGNHDSIRGEELNNLQWSFGSKPMDSNPSPYGAPGLASAGPNSKYLKAAQQLLEEVVNVRKSLKQPESDKHKSLNGLGLKGSKETGFGLPSNPEESMATAACELSPAERQDLQNKLTKLLSMLDEVDRRYKLYHHQMQIVVSSFDVIAGSGSAKPYTALALQTISRHFRCLRDAISGQVRATRRSLGEQDTLANSKEGGISRLRYVDQQLRQQRALQQLGMMQQHAWRPQRGLPENSVSVLRAWLFEHFLHPYPKDSDKIMLARQTGLTRSQVSNWFINARVRLWKPMVEEMYKEEIGDAEIDSNSSSEMAFNADKEEELQQNMKFTTTERCHTRQFHDSKSNSIPDIEMTEPAPEEGFQDRLHGEDDKDYGIMKSREDQRPNLQDALVQMGELETYRRGSGVSLTLGLQHCDDASMAMSGGTHHNFFTMRGDEIYNTAVSSVGPDAEDYDCMDQVNQRHRFVTSSHMLHDFVA